MRKSVRLAATIALAATALAGPLVVGVSAAPVDGPMSIYAPSDLVLTVGKGTSAAGSVPLRAVTLTCAPTASGTHPAAVDACRQLRAVGGQLDALGDGSAACAASGEPEVVTAVGVWQGKRVSYERTFANSCVKDSQGQSVFAF